MRTKKLKRREGEIIVSTQSYYTHYQINYDCFDALKKRLTVF